MGGYGTWLTTLLHPEKYAKACPLSGTNSRGGSKGNIGVIDLYELISRKNDSGEQLTEYYYMCGTEDPAYQFNEDFLNYVAEKCPNVKVKKETWPGKHDFFFWNQAIPKALKFFGFEVRQDSVI